MIDNEPTIAALDVSEAIARRQGLGFAVPDVGKRVVAGINRCRVVDTDQLIPEK